MNTATMDANKALSDVVNNFTTKDGIIVRNLHQLEATLSHMPQETFNKHVSKGKNDFSKWLLEEIGDENLAESISKCESRKKMLHKIRERLIQLHKIRHRQLCPYDEYLAHGAGHFSLGIIVGIIAGMIIASI